MANIHEAFRRIISEFNQSVEAEKNSDEQIEAIIRTYLEEALAEAGKEIEKLFELTNVVISVNIHEVCVYSEDL